MSTSVAFSPDAPFSPIVIDEPALTELASAGYRWKDGQAELVRYRWLLPPDWVLAAQLPPRARNGIESLCGAGDGQGRMTAVLGFLRGVAEPPHVLITRGAAPGARIASFSSRSGPVAERVEQKGGKLVVTTIHAFSAGGEPYRFFIAALGVDEAATQILRTIGSALSLADDLDRFRTGRLHG